MQSAETLRRTALLLVLAGLAWNVVEAVVALWAGLQAGSVAILAFGLDSIVEIFAGGVLVWRLRTDLNESDAEAAEQRAQKLLGITFFLLAAYVVLHSGANLVGWFPEPEPSLAGIVIVAASAIVMAILYVAKMRIAVQLQSRSLKAEAMESLFCDIQDLTLLIGIGFNALFAWWWADPVAALFIVPWLIKEGKENFAGHDHDHEDDELCVCFCGGCYFGIRECRAECCRA